MGLAALLYGFRLLNADFCLFNLAGRSQGRSTRYSVPDAAVAAFRRAAATMGHLSRSDTGIIKTLKLCRSMPDDVADINRMVTVTRPPLMCTPAAHLPGCIAIIHGIFLL